MGARRMGKTCEKCGEVNIDSKLIACPKCKQLLDDKKSQDRPFSQKEIAAIRRIMWKGVWFILGGISIATVITFGGVSWDAVRAIKKSLKNRLNEEIRTERIQTVFRDVASSQAAELLSNEIKPTVDEFRRETSASLSAIREETSSTLMEIQHLRKKTVALEKEIHEIAETLKPRAILTSVSPSQNELGHSFSLIFVPIGSARIGSVELRLILPENSDATILDFAPNPGKPFLSSSDSKVISDDKRSARIRFTPLSDAFWVDLTLSGVSAFKITGTHGVDYHYDPNTSRFYRTEER